jgi:dolichyl-phosphate beta-glucosyltransferase
MTEPHLSLVIPVYNAASFLAERMTVLQSFLSDRPFETELILVDDGSIDDTWSVMQRIDATLLRIDRNRGKFAAIRVGMKEASGRCCAFTDADVPYDLRILDEMVELTTHKGFHVAVGDRTLPDSTYGEELRPLRRVGTKAFRNVIRLLFAGELPDTQCGIKAFRGDIVPILFGLLQEDRFAGDIELLYVALKHNLAIRRLPVQFVYGAPSSLRPIRDSVAMFARAVQLPHRYRRGHYESAELRRLARI